MKVASKFLLLALCMLAIVGCENSKKASKSDSKVSVNLVKNGDFSRWSKGDNQAPDHPDYWDYYFTNSNYQKAKFAYMGEYSVLLTAKSGKGINPSVYQKISNQEKPTKYWHGKNVSIGCWVYSTTLSAQIVATNWKTINVATARSTVLNKWEWLTATGTIPDDMSGDFCVSCQIISDTGTAYFTGFTLVEGKSISN